MADTSPLTMHAAEPFFFPGSATGVLLVHGFTGTPFEMRWAGEYLARQGYTVLAVRLAGHATRLEDLARTRWSDWLASVEDGLNLIKGAAEHIFLMGLSLGGVLSLITASRFPVAGVITMSTPYDLPHDPRLPFVRPLSLLIPKIPKGAPDWHNPQAALDHIEYPYNPTRAIAELNDLLKVLRACLSDVQVPALLVHSRADQGIVPENAEQIYAALGSVDKKIMWVENSGHNIPREPDREAVFAAADAFIQRCLVQRLA
jgi:carboxylesterase